MLARTAESLYWLARYTERAGNVARGLSAGLRAALIAGPEEEEGWRALLVATGTDPGYRARHGAGAPPTAEAVVAWLTLDPANPSSVASCFEAARRNARAVRAAITADMWEAVNDTWMETARRRGADLRDEAVHGFLDWAKSRASAFDGAVADTMLRDDAWRFTHLGTMLERADNTARLLDARHPAFAPGAEADPWHANAWAAVLRSVSALRAYQYLYRARVAPARVAELLVLRREFPRSLRFCYARADATLREVATDEGREGREALLDLSASLLGRCASGTGGHLLAAPPLPTGESGLHGFLTAAVDDNLRLGAAIARCFLRG